MKLLDSTTSLEALIETHGAALLAVAEKSIRHGHGHGEPLKVTTRDQPSALAENGASFVTLHNKGELRGCIGTARPWRSLLVDIAANAYSAAFEDPRFRSVRVDELETLDIELSLLGPPVPFPVSSEAELIASLVPGRDGLILIDGPRRGLFLPAVWESVTGAADFVAHLKEKAGIARWSARVTAQRFETRSVARRGQER